MDVACRHRRGEGGGLEDGGEGKGGTGWEGGRNAEWEWGGPPLPLPEERDHKDLTRYRCSTMKELIFREWYAPLTPVSIIQNTNTLALIYV